MSFMSFVFEWSMSNFVVRQEMDFIWAIWESFLINAESEIMRCKPNILLWFLHFFWRLYVSCSKVNFLFVLVTFSYFFHEKVIHEFFVKIFIKTKEIHFLLYFTQNATKMFFIVIFKKKKKYFSIIYWSYRLTAQKKKTWKFRVFLLRGILFHCNFCLSYRWHMGMKKFKKNLSCIRKMKSKKFLILSRRQTFKNYWNESSLSVKPISPSPSSPLIT